MAVASKCSATIGECATSCFPRSSGGSVSRAVRRYDTLGRRSLVAGALAQQVPGFLRTNALDVDRAARLELERVGERRMRGRTHENTPRRRLSLEPAREV